MATLAREPVSTDLIEVLSANYNVEYDVTDILIYNFNTSSNIQIDFQLDSNDGSDPIAFLGVDVPPKKTLILNLTSSLSLNNEEKLVAQCNLDGANVFILGTATRRT